MTAQSAPHTKWTVALGLGAGAALAVGLVVLAFLWPTKTMATQNLPVSIVGDADAVSAVGSAMEQAVPGAIELVTAADRDAALEQILTRETYGAIVLSPSAPEVLTAPAASAASTQMLTQLGGQLQAQLQAQAAAAGAAAPTVAITPVVPLSATDPTGTGLAGAAFPLAMGGMIGGVLVSLAVVGPVRRIAAVTAFGVGAGLVVTLVLHTWFEFLQGGFWMNVLALGLAISATSAFIVGCASLIGRAGIAIGAVVTLFVANPLSAAAVPWQFLAEPWGAIGQYLVPGAAMNLVRTISYFPDADATKQWLVLLAWFAIGVVLTVAGHYRSQEPMHVPQATLEPEVEAASA